jgi:hypothetical protein
MRGDISGAASAASERLAPRGSVRVSSTWERIAFPVVLLLLMGAGLYLRLTYLLTTSPYIDEYTTMWVAQRTLQHGYPVFSTGSIYAQGLLFTYLDALFFLLFGFSETVARMPSLIVSVCTIPSVYLVWGGRARNYALIQLLLLWAVYLFYKWAIADEGSIYRWLFVLTFSAAVLTHNVAMLLYPACLFCAFLARGWRWFFKRQVMLANVLVFVGMALSLYLYRRLRPPGWSEVGEGRLEVGVSFNLLGAIERYKPFFLGLDDLPFAPILTVLCVLGVAILFWRVLKRRSFSVVLSPSSEFSSLR